MYLINVVHLALHIKSLFRIHSIYIMDTCKFTDTQFDAKTTRASFVFSRGNNKGPTQIYRLDNENFEIRNSDNNSIHFQLHRTDVDEEVTFQYANHFYLEEKLYFFIAAKSIEGLNSFIYLVDTSKEPPIQRLEFNRQMKGIVTNIFVSNALKVRSLKVYIAGNN